MKNIIAITKKELRTYFASPLAYIVIGVFLLICGVFFSIGLFLQGQATMRNAFQIIPYVYTLLIPGISMRLIAEEKKSGTFELLSTMPVTNFEIVAGKYLAALVLLVVALFFTLTYTITVAALGDVDGGSILAGYVGLVLLGAGYMAVGLLISALTENQIVAFLMTALFVLALSLVNKFLGVLPARVANVLEYLGAEFHFENVARGVLDSRDLVYYASLIVLSLYFSARALERRF
jgi:ABC-2 type transport system permease protein